MYPKLRQLLSIILYHIGDGISKVMERLDWDWLYGVYSWIMLKSYDLDKENKVWKPIDDRESKEEV